MPVFHALSLRERAGEREKVPQTQRFYPLPNPLPQGEGTRFVAH
ncbi:hypothetical protein [Alysiella filiformis]|nr:hypothetical protein [Alysiella filiformis]